MAIPSEEAPEYDDYFIVASERNRIGLMTCLKCGSCIIVQESGSLSTDLHNEWHKEWQRRA